MINRIFGNIYLSSFAPLSENEDLFVSHRITSILSLLPGPIPEQYKKDYNHKQYEILDIDSTNILEIIPSCNDFIEKSLYNPSESIVSQTEVDHKKHRGTILIHCAQGISRSVSIVAAYLMWKHKLTSSQALQVIKKKCPISDPIQNFKDQLKAYEEMGCNIDPDSNAYQRIVFQLKSKTPSVDNLRHTENLEDASKNDDPEHVGGELRCKRCRQSLAESYVPHSQPGTESRESQFIKRVPKSRRIVSVQNASNSCSHYFLNPVKWMQSELDKGELEGKFSCPKCDAKVGGYNWKGSRCSCGKWMIPAIDLQRAKVDEIKILHLSK